MKKVAVLLSLGVFLTVSCGREQESQVSNVSFTPCQQTKATRSELSDRVDVEFTNEGVKITHYNFVVTCDFTVVNVTHSFVNGVLSIIQQGTPNQANCICYTDVSYTISGIAHNEINVIFINGVQVYCHNEDSQAKKLLLGKWGVIPSYNSIVEITENNFNFIMGVYETWSYQWISNNSIEIVRPDYTTRNEVIFHTLDSVTIKGFWLSDASVHPPEYYDAILMRASYGNDEFFKATVHGIGGDCRLLLIGFDEVVPGLKSPIPNFYYAHNIPEEYQIQGKRIEVQLGSFPKDYEISPCTTMGPGYSHVYIIKIR